MSHEIQEHDIQESPVQAWHGLTTIKEDLTLANCWLRTWDYKPEPVVVERDGKLIKTPFMALGVTDVEGLYVGECYMPDSFKPCLNERLCALLEKATDGKDLKLASNGTIKNRGRQFLSFEMGESYKAADRVFKPYFNIGNGNDKSSPIWQNTSNTCTVCNNTFNDNMLNCGLIMEVKKTKFSDLKLGDFRQAAKAMLAGQGKFIEAFEKLALIPCDETLAREFFAGFVGEPMKPLSTRGENIIEELIKLFKTGAGNDGNDFSDIFQAGTDHYTHFSAGGDDKWKQFVSSEFGAGNKAKIRLWETLTNEKMREGIVIIGKDILTRTVEAAKEQTAKA